MSKEKKEPIELEFWSFEEVFKKELEGGTKPRTLVAGVDGKPDVFWDCCPRGISSQTPTPMSASKRS